MPDWQRIFNREQWLTDEHIAHPYMRQADGSRVDAVRNLDKGSPNPQAPDVNPGRSFMRETEAITSQPYGGHHEEPGLVLTDAIGRAG